ncbi:MAG: ABC transporter ATP-binding protein [Candidatus Nanopelagicales bacterium]
MAVVVRAVGATVQRGDRDIVDNVTWTVETGQRWVILGPNGAGKTSLMDILATTSHPTSGSVEILGEPLGLTDVFGLRSAIGVVSTRTTARIPERESVLDVVMTAGWAIAGRFRERYDPVDVDRAHAMLETMGIGHLAIRRFGTLSDGEQKRALVARALFPDPELLLLDEPAAGLDLGSREGLVERLGHLAADPDAPVQVMITHHVEEIPPGYTHAMLMRYGTVLEQGEIDLVLTDENLTRTFDVELSVRRVFNRYWAFAT